MTNQEFSDSFTTLLNSYSLQANFGEGSSKAEITLDEYEKSVLLTQAQDIIVKSYFDNRLNPQSEGFDDGARRQIDFSTLIKVAILSPTSGGLLYDERGKLFKLPRKVVNGVVQENTTDVLFILNEKLIVESTLGNGSPKRWILTDDDSKVYYSEPKVSHVDKSQYWTINDDTTRYYSEPIETIHSGVEGFWTINDEPTHYASKPSYVYHEAVSSYWTINDDDTRYYTKPNKTKSSRSVNYWTVNTGTTEYTTEPVVSMDSASYFTINDGETHYVSAEITNYDPGSPEYWTIGSDPTHFLVDPTNLLEHVDENSYWIINGDDSVHYLTEPTITPHTVYEYWTITIDGVTTIYIYEPEIIYRGINISDVSARPSGGVGYYIIDPYYGEQGPYDTMPTVQGHKEPLTYWTVNDENTIYFSEPVKRKVIVQEKHWMYSGHDFYTSEKPTVTHVNAVAATWTVLVDEGEVTEEELTFTSEPTIIPHGGTWKVTVGETVILSGLTEEPTIHSHVMTVSYWTIDVTGNVEYATDPLINYYEGSSAYYTVSSIPANSNTYESVPEIIEHPGTTTYWTVQVNDTIYLEDPTITSHIDSSMNYYIINDEPEHYSSAPEFRVVEGEEPQRSKKEYIIVPISYREYDREMSRPYSQPLKKQAWRLFQNNSTGFDFDSELIPRFNVVPHASNPAQPGYSVGDVQLTYKIRYIRRPRPIILEDLPNELEIDGESNYSSCELNPIVHMDILNKAVELAIATRGKIQQPQPQK